MVMRKVTAYSESHVVNELNAFVLPGPPHLHWQPSRTCNNKNIQISSAV